MIFMRPSVAAIILNWNGWEDTVKCLESLYQIDYRNFDVILVDNASSDNSIGNLRKNFKIALYKEFEFFENNFKKLTDDHTISLENGLVPKKDLIVIKNDKNYGFAEGNNIGIKYALKNLNPDYILLLNNDTVVDKDFLTELIEVAESDESIGSVQSLLLRPGGKLIDSLGQEIYLWGANDKRIGMEFAGNIKNIEIFGACAAAALYRSKTLKKVGLLDKDFFYIFEDVDISWKIRLHGLKSILASKSIVYHKRGISEPMVIKEIIFGEKNPKILFKWYHGSKNWLIIVLRYYSLSLIFKAMLKHPHKFFFTFFRYCYSSVKLGKPREAFKIFKNNIKIRKEIKKNPLLKDIQIKWIK